MEYFGFFFLFMIANLGMEVYYYHSTHGYDRTLDPHWATNDHGRHDLFTDDGSWDDIPRYCAGVEIH